MGAVALVWTLLWGDRGASYGFRGFLWAIGAIWTLLWGCMADIEYFEKLYSGCVGLMCYIGGL